MNYILDRYNVLGYFYRKYDNNFRKYLDIVNKKDAPNQPDLMVVMMNPGNSKPKEGFSDENYFKEVSARPDNTQLQVVKYMEGVIRYKYARILNLSDICETKSAFFYKLLNEPSFKELSHSIFHKSRQIDFNEKFVEGVPVVAAWGVSYKLNALIKLAVQRFKKLDVTPIGLLKAGTNYKYYHPQRRIDKIHHFKSWEEEMLEKY